MFFDKNKATAIEHLEISRLSYVLNIVSENF